MPLDVVLTCGLIVLARMVDVSLGTLRTVFVVQGRGVVSFIIGFVEVLIWVVVVSKVVQNLDQPVYAVSYATGFALGTFLGVRIEGRIAVGQQVIRIFTRKGAEMEAAMRDKDFFVTVFDGRGRDGPIQLMFVKISRRCAHKALSIAREVDPSSFCVVDDIRFGGPLQPSLQQPTGWRAVLKKK